MEAYQIFSWFLKYDVGLRVAFAITTFLVFFFAYRMYKLTNKRELKIFSISFLVFSISYIITVLLNLTAMLGYTKGMGRLLKMHGMHGLKIFGFYAQGVLFLIGLVLLVYMATRIKDKKILLLLLGLTVIPMIVVPRPLMLFHTIAALLLAYVVVFYYSNYMRRKRRHALLVLLAFAFLFFGHLLFVFSVHKPVFHLLGDMLELVAYLFILANLLLLGRK